MQGPLPHFFLTLSYKVSVHSSFQNSTPHADNHAEQGQAQGDAVRCLNAKGKETPILRGQLCIYRTLSISSSVNVACKVPHLSHPSPVLIENSCCVYLPTKLVGISAPHSQPCQSLPPLPPLCKDDLSCKCTQPEAWLDKLTSSGDGVPTPFVYPTCSREREEAVPRARFSLLVSKSVSQCVDVVQKLCYSQSPGIDIQSARSSGITDAIGELLVLLSAQGESL